MEAHLCSKESLQSPGGGYEGDKKTKDTYPTLLWGPLRGKGAESRLGGEATGAQHHLPAYSWAFLQAEREHTLVRPQPEETCSV